MPHRNTDSNRNTVGNTSIIINCDVKNSNIIIGDNSVLNTPASPGQQIGKMIVSELPSVAGSELARSKLIPFLCYAKENSTVVREFCERLKAEDWIDP